jgi:starvation-inducible DNA-binding protein
MKKELVLKSKKYLANINVNYVKLHNLHWNVVGLQFKPVHEYLEGLYDSMHEIFDEVAELLKMNGEFPLASLKDFLAVSEVKELESKDYSVKESLEIALADIKVLRDNALELRRLASDEDFYPLQVMMEDHLANYNKVVWFIESMLK